MYKKMGFGFFNRFFGSLISFKDLKRLKKIDISHTDIDAGVEYLPKSLVDINCNHRFAEVEKEPKVKKIEKELRMFISNNLVEVLNIFLSTPLSNSNIQEEIITEELYEKIRELEIIGEKFEFNRFKFAKELFAMKFIEKLIPSERLRNNYLKYKLCKDCYQPNNLLGFCRNCSIKKLGNLIPCSNYIIQYYGEYQKDNDIFIINKDKGHDWQLNYNFIRQIVKGLRYLHNENVLHRDLKSYNVLITEGYIAKLADFGLAKLLNSSDYSSSGKKITGTIRWLAPEVLRGDNHSYQSDVYSLGMVMWEIASKDTWSFKDLDNNGAVIFQVGGNNLRETIPGDVPSELVEIIQLCWKENPKQRINLENIETQLNEMIIKEEWHLEAVVEVKTN